MTKEKELPDNAPDEMWRHQGIEGLISNPAGGQILAQDQAKDQEIMALRERDYKRDILQGEITDEELNEHIELVDNAAWEDYKTSEEGDHLLRKDFHQKYGVVPAGESSENVYQQGHRGYLERKAEKEQERDK